MKQLLLAFFLWKLCFLCFPSGTFATGTPLELGAKDSFLVANPHVQVLVDPTGGDWNLDDVLRNEHLFQNAPSAYTRMEVYWGKLILHNQVDEPREWIFSPDWDAGVKRNTHVDVYIASTGDTLKTGKYLPYSQKEGIAKKFPHNQVIIPMAAGATDTLYFSFKNIEHRLPVLEARVMTQEYWLSQNTGLRIVIQAIFQGMLGIMMLNALLNFFTRPSRSKAYLFYALFLASASFYFLSVSSALLETVLREYPEVNLYVWVVAVNLLGVGFFQFARVFLNTKRLMPLFDRIGKAIIYTILGVIVVELFAVNYTFNFDLLEKINRAILMIEVTFLLVVSLRYARIASGLGRIFLWGTLCIVAAGYVGVILDSFDIFQDTLPFIELFFVVQTLTFSWGLGVRHSQLKKQHLKDKQEKERLAEMDALKSRFFNDASHELRTPITVMLGNVEQLQSDWQQQDEAKTDQQLDAVHRNGKILLRLTNQILDLGKLESNTYEPDWRHGDIMVPLHGLVASFANYALGQEKNLVFENEPAELFMDYEASGLESIVNNLLSNAFKFTQKGDQITVKVQTISQNEAPRLILEISDTGKGIAVDDLPYIFDRYYQSAKNPVHLTGTGIGLALIKRLVEAYEGSVSVRSQLGEGTTFRVELPIHQQFVDRPDDTKITDRSTTSLPAVNSHNGQAKDFEKSQILVVEDNLEVLYFLKTSLMPQFEVETATNGAEGISKATELIPDLVVSDVMMPEKDGYELCQTLKTDSRTDHIPIILLTARAGDQDRITGLKHGADGYLTKPFQREHLLVRIEKLIENRRKLREKYAGLPPEEVRKKENPFLTKARELIEANLTDEAFDTKVLAGKMGMSDTQFRRKIKALTDQTPTLFVRNVRLDRAAMLLRNSELNISEVGYEVGYNDPAFFSRVFTKRFGMSPSVYRDQKRK
jgi:signal transduction histidine kinase/AraC-like DNA-binding protein